MNSNCRMLCEIWETKVRYLVRTLNVNKKHFSVLELFWRILEIKIEEEANVSEGLERS